MALEAPLDFHHSHSYEQNRTMRVYHYSDIQVMAAAFPTAAYGILAYALAFLLPPFTGHGVPVRRLAVYQTYLIIVFSCQRTLDCICQSVKIHYWNNGLS